MYVLTGLTQEEIEKITDELHQSKFRARQIHNWIYLKSAKSIDEMTDLSKDFREELKSKADVISLDALELAQKAGSIKVVNVVLIGVLAKSTDIPYEAWIDTIKTTVPEKFLDVNLKAFELGYNL